MGGSCRFPQAILFPNAHTVHGCFCRFRRGDLDFGRRALTRRRAENETLVHVLSFASWARNLGFLGEKSACYLSDFDTAAVWVVLTRQALKREGAKARKRDSASSTPDLIGPCETLW